MQIILREDVENLGHKNEIVNVKAGYGRNFLIPKGLATLAIHSAKKVHEENVRQRLYKEEKIIHDATTLAEQLKTRTLRIGAKVSSTGKIFGSVNTIQIAEAIRKKGFEIDRKNITIHEEDAIKELGTYKATIKLHKDVKVEIEFEVFSE